MEYGVFLMEGDRQYLLPVNPESMERHWESQMDIVKVMGIGQVVLPDEGTLERFRLRAPLDMPMMELLRGWREKGTVLTLLVFGQWLYIRKEVVIHKMTVTQHAGLETEMDTQLELLEYRGYRKAELERKQQQERMQSTGSQSTGRTYTVAKGDSLWRIAKRELGDGRRYTEIYELNRDIIRNANLIYPGQVLRLPE